MKPGTVFSARGIATLALLCAATPLFGQERVTKEPVRQPAQQTPQGQQKEHVVRKGDTLWDLAQFYFNDPYRWPLIYDANKNVVRNPHWIYPTEKLIIPGMTRDSLVGTPVAEVPAVPAGPNRSRFYVVEKPDTEGPTLLSTEMVRIPLVQPLEWLAAPWITDTSQIKVVARVYKPYDPRDQDDKLPQQFHTLDKLYLSTSAPLSANQQLLAIRLNRNLRGVGWVIEPMGILKIDSVGQNTAVAIISRQFSDLKVGDVAIALPAVPGLPVGNTIEVTGGPNGTILDFLVEHPLYTNTDYAFIDLGSAQGLSIGDELVAIMPTHQPSTKHPEILIEQPIAKMQVIRVNERNSTVRVTGLNNNGLEVGLPVRVARKAPTGDAAKVLSSTDARAVKLDFNWPAGIEATVHVRKYKLTNGASRDSTESGLNYRLRTSVASDGLLVSYDSFSIATKAGMLSSAELQSEMGNVMPSFVVDRKGEFVRAVGIDAMRKQLQTLLGPDIAKETNPQTAQLLRNLLSDDALTSAAVQEWNALVGVWADAAMVKGQTLEQTAEEPQPLLGNLTLPMHYEYTLNDWVPCTPKETARNCVELEMRSTPDPDALKEVMNKIVPADVGKTYKLESIEIGHRVVVVTEPQRLLPHRVTIGKTVTLHGRDAGKPHEYSSWEVKFYDIDYTRR